MKKLLLSAALLTAAISANAQWTEYYSGYSSVSRGINSIVAVNDTIVWTRAYDGSGGSATIQEVAVSSDGMNWSESIMTDAATADFGTMGVGSIAAVDKNTAYAAMFPNAGTSSATGIWKTSDGGLSWARTSAGFTTASFPDVVHFFDALKGIAVGDPVGGYFEVYVTIDGGTTWTRVPNTGNQLSPINASEYGLTDVQTHQGNTFFFGTDNGRIFKTTDFGVTWSVSNVKLQVPTVVSISKIAFRDANHGICSYYNATPGAFVSAVTADGGTTWTALTPSGTMYNSDYCAVPNTNMYVSVGAATTLSGSSMSTDDGATWQLIEDQSALPQPIQRTAVAFSSDTVGYSGSFTDGTVGGIFRWDGPVVAVPLVGLNTTNSSSTSTISVFPNPAGNSLSIKLNGFKGKNTEIKIVNLLGEVVYSNATTYETPFFTKHIDLTGFNTGIYVVEVTEGANHFVQKVVKN